MCPTTCNVSVPGDVTRVLLHVMCLSQVTRHVPCKNMFSLGHVCKGPAEFVFTVRLNVHIVHT